MRVLLSLAVNYGWELQQFDIKNAFLHRKVKKEIYMKIALCYGRKVANHTICNLEKDLYDLKQSP